MARCDVFVRAGNDYRETSIGGRRNSSSGYSWINFDWFKGKWIERPNRQYKDPETAPKVTEFHTDASGTSSVSTRVTRSDNGSVRISVSFDDIRDIPEDVVSVSIDFDGVGIHFDVADVKLVKEYFNVQNMDGIAILAAFALIPDIKRMIAAEESGLLTKKEALEEFTKKRDAIMRVLEGGDE